MRFRLEIVRLTTCVLMLGCATAWAAADASIPQKWKLAYTSTSEPTRGIYVGQLKFLSYADPSKPDAGSATFDVWGKAVYKKPQSRGALTYSVDIVELRLDCAASTVTPLREVLQDADGKTILDDRKAKATKHVDFNGMSDLDSVALDENIAFIATDFTCSADLD